MLLLAASTILCLHGIGWGLPNTNGWHGDSLCQSTLRALGDGFAGFTKYPPVHHVVLALVYLPYLAWLWMSGGLDVSAGSLEQAFEDPVSAMTVLIMLTRLVSVALTLATVGILYLLAVRLTANRTAGLVAGALYAVSAEVALFSKLTMVDGPMVFWFGLGLLAYVHFLQDFRVRDGCWLGVVVAVGVCTKEQIGGAWVLAGIGAVVAAWKQHVRVPEGPALRAVLTAGASWVLAYGLCSKLFLDPAGWAERMRAWLDEGINPSLWSGHPNSVAGHLALLRDTGQNLLGAWGLAPLLLGALAGSWALLRGPREVRLLALPLVSYYLFTIAPLHYVMSRFTIPLVLLLALLAGIGLAPLLAAGGARRSLAGLALALALGQGGYRAWRTGTLMGRDPRYAAEAFLAESLSEGARVEVYADDQYLPRMHGMELERRHMGRAYMNPSAFEQRAPRAVVLAPGYHWKLDADQRSFLAWLCNSPDYTLHLFEGDPADAGFLSDEDMTAIQPQILVLLRKVTP